MKRILTALVILCSATVNAETVVCKQFGYAPTPDDFHSIALIPSHSEFEITPTRVTKLSIGSVFDKVDPESVGLGDMDVLTYRQGMELLYIYKDKGKVQIATSELVEDSDDIFADKSLFSDCSFVEPQGGSQHAVASKSSRALEARGVGYTIPVHRF